MDVGIFLVFAELISDLVNWQSPFRSSRAAMIFAKKISPAPLARLSFSCTIQLTQESR
jgi:hypothetical protein